MYWECGIYGIQMRDLVEEKRLQVGKHSKRGIKEISAPVLAFPVLNTMKR